LLQYEHHIGRPKSLWAEGLEAATSSKKGSIRQFTYLADHKRNNRVSTSLPGLAPVDLTISQLVYIPDPAIPREEAAATSRLLE
jgi:hypothetical protein